MLPDAGLHLDHGLPASLEGRDLSLVSACASVLALSLQQFPLLLQGHGQLLLTAELISQPSGINHSAGSLVLRQPGLVAHLAQVALELVVLRLELPLGGGNGLVDIAQVSQVLIGVSELLLGATSLPVSSLKKGAALLKGIGHGGRLPVSGHLVVGGGRLGLGLGVNLGLTGKDV